MQKSAHLIEKITRSVWGVDPASLPSARARVTRLLRIVWVVVRDALEGQLTLRAMSLVYTTLLSLVPLLAVSFSVLKGFGVHNQLEPLLLQAMAPLGEKGVEITRNIIGFVENMNVGVLGALGLGLLVYTVISLIQKIEYAFNYIWRVAHPRPFVQRFSDYLSVIVVGPLLAFSAMGVTASLASMDIVRRARNIEQVGSLIDLLARLVPYVLIIAAFTFVYVFVPNTRVRLRSALAGAVVAGILWQSAGWLFASFVVDSTRYTAVYSGLAIPILFMIWLYLGWMIMLMGANISFYHQHPEQLTTRRRQLALSNRLKERLALSLMYLIGRSHCRGDAKWSSERLSAKASMPAEAVEAVLDALVAGELLVRTDDDPPAYVPARALDAIALEALLEAVRRADEDPYLRLSALVAEGPVDALTRELDEALRQALGGRSLRDLIDQA
jgi:membrane protein